MDILSLTTNYERHRGSVPELPIENFFVETIPSEGRAILQSRPGLEVLSEISTDPVRAIYSEPNVFDGALFTVIGYTVYKDGVSIGTIDGDDPVSIDSYSDRTFFAAGGQLWKYDGSTLAAVALPDSFSPLRIVVAASRLVLIEKNTQTLFWSNVLSDTVDALSFAEAESSPDLLLDMILIGDTLLLFGQATTEFWVISGTDPDLPFVPIIGRVFAKGLRNTGAATRLVSSNAFAWVSETDQICMNDPSKIISDSELELRIGASSSVTLWTFNLDQSEYLAVRLDEETWIFSPGEQGAWVKFTTSGLTNWEPCCYANDVFGSSVSGRTLQWGTTAQDEGTEVFERLFRVYAPLATTPVVVNSLMLATDGGTTEYTSGDYANPVIEMRSSKDGGKTWSDYRPASLGEQGKYRTFVRWLGCGIFSYPGMMFEFRMTHPVAIRISHVYANEPFGGY